MPELAVQKVQGGVIVGIRTGRCAAKESRTYLPDEEARQLLEKLAEILGVTLVPGHP